MRNDLLTFKRYLISVLLFSFINQNVSSQEDKISELNDGPYVFIEKKKLIERSIVDGKLTERELGKKAFPTKFKAETSVYTNVSKIVALSDVHGQYDLLINLLKSNKVIDDKLDWTFGDGHMVITGDVFDRGDKVTEVLWFLYNLEKKAKAKGGNLHYLLGNHEHMVLQNDLRYIHEKYAKSAELLELSYNDVFGINTVLGRWLRSKATMIKIDDKVFVHGGISKDFLDREVGFKKANKLYRKSIDLTKDEMKEDSAFLHFYASPSPIWYRGYFLDDLPESEIDNILERMDANEIIVGHTSQTQVVRLYNGKIYAVDSSIKNGEYGELLFMDGEERYRGTLTGQQLEFQDKD